MIWRCFDNIAKGFLNSLQSIQKYQPCQYAPLWIMNSRMHEAHSAVCFPCTYRTHWLSPTHSALRRVSRKSQPQASSSDPGFSFPSQTPSNHSISTCSSLRTATPSTPLLSITSVWPKSWSISNPCCSFLIFVVHGKCWTPLMNLCTALLLTIHFSYSMTSQISSKYSSLSYLLKDCFIQISLSAVFFTQRTFLMPPISIPTQVHQTVSTVR